MKAWLFQDTRQKQKLGDKAPWSVGWFDPDGKKRSKRVGLKSAADKYRRRIEGELAAGTHAANIRKRWDAFRSEYESKILDGAEPKTREATQAAFEAFERHVKPAKVSVIRTQTIDDFIAKRRKDRGRKKDSTASPATVNKDLRHLKAVLRVAHDWGYLPKVPRIRMLREPDKLPRYVSPEDFAKMYGACDAALKPNNLSYEPADWWRAMLVFVYMTGWRISEPIALRRDDLNLDAGTAITRHGDNKGKRDDIVRLHPVVIEHLRLIPSFEPNVFPWYLDRTSLYGEFHRIQDAAGLSKPWYGFHDIRRAFATVNAESLTADELQALMRHKSYTTTQRYINMAKRMNQVTDKLHVPEVLRKAVIT